MGCLVEMVNESPGNGGFLCGGICTGAVHVKTGVFLYGGVLQCTWQQDGCCIGSAAL